MLGSLCTSYKLTYFQAFFSEVTYQKSIVESKNKVYQKVNTSKPKLKNVDFSVIDQSVEEMNQRFQVRILCGLKF